MQDIRLILLTIFLILNFLILGFNIFYRTQVLKSTYEFGAIMPGAVKRLLLANILLVILGIIFTAIFLINELIFRLFN
ncbi:MAG: hypothetical protein ACD_30C00049G0013 [uncultured bacterium]|uniref:Uncharacterized protein n=4 Tax=Candidatus Daviesiibacteriota TaxID=1752718 RepID=A0A0G0I3M7_9BACT|nr:MAG: hypothetical protein ACD_30C00049G0013 [uncultured bacterium]KKQ10691.1 MAG: hypothetical protein US19_C0001G0029 [Candidatus Daviesbacteria bacterium GW2011_GWB1_36_5]KKQ15013.1 MAG: hypothetical protein US28_C0025G0036 [Candidatus Daviesbacteria bacterium GW2011_GWA1_36_8]OGE16857.1 MAG: hypothetical protein A2858_03045 [Candidatus Daviesbacteria bacterium RIFCSPHIGHO2_01_FULL_36_37]OGE31213.1 MAG: hypothetical protein A3C99_01020 [Candidatus Daviesbacteria bacterium RIFCSPHIGHO2_02_F